jgi:hypothetical protein
MYFEEMSSYNNNNNSTLPVLSNKKNKNDMNTNLLKHKSTKTMTTNDNDDSNSNSNINTNNTTSLKKNEIMKLKEKSVKNHPFNKDYAKEVVFIITIHYYNININIIII